MARETSQFWSYLLASFVAFMVGAQAVHWFISPTSASASAARWWAVLAQALLGLGVGVWFLRRARAAGRGVGASHGGATPARDRTPGGGG